MTPLSVWDPVTDAELQSFAEAVAKQVKETNDTR